MNNTITYLLESGFCLLVFYIFYLALLKRETFYRLNRAFLLFSVAFSILIPLLNISITHRSDMAFIPTVLEAVTVSAGQGSFIPSEVPRPGSLIPVIYLLVAGVLSMRLLLNIRRINMLNKYGVRQDNLDYRLVVHDRDHPPFSFFRTIFISEKYYTDDSLEEIIEHERAHIRQLHSVDILVSEMMIILQWFNPLAWTYKKMIRENHEFLADEAVLNRGFNPDAYQLRIISQLFGIRSMPAAQYFNQSIIQKRLKMIKKPKSPSMARLKFLLVIPAALAMFYMFACSSGESEMAAQDVPEASKESLVYAAPDVMAEYPGGTIALRKFIAQTVTYPEVAKNKGVQGKVYIQFIVDEFGKVVPMIESSSVPPPPPPPPPVDGSKNSGEDAPPPPPPATIDIEGIVVVGYRPPEGMEVEYTREDIQLLVDEAIRVIKLVPEKWIPAKKDGKPVKSAWTIPIQFTLQ